MAVANNARMPKIVGYRFCTICDHELSKKYAYSVESRKL